MPSSALILIVVSALFHAFWNVAVKRVEDRFVLLALAHVVMAVVLTPFLGGGAVRLLAADPALMLPLTGATFFFALYHLGVTGGYKAGDLSLVYPVTTMAPAIVPLWGWIFLGERLSLPGLAGIGLVVAGAYAIQFRSFSLSALADPFRQFDRSMAFALGAALAYSVGAVFDKAGIGHTSALTWSYLLVVWMAVLEMVMAAVLGMGPWEYTRRSWKHSLWMALILLGSILTYRYGLKASEVSYATSVRQVNALFGVLFGIFLFRERFGGLRIAAALVMVGGVIVIKTMG